jgi:hypothetical protein
MAERKISYTERDFVGLRDELLNYVQSYYPDLIQNFNDASVFSVLMDLNAGIADNLHYHIDRSLQETVLQYAQQRSSIYNIARTYGLKIPGYRPSVAVVDLSITVPAFGDSEDVRYLGKIRAGSQFFGAGNSFENLYDIDFSTQYNEQGQVNRTKVPSFDANNKIINYVITKREVLVNGTTKVFKRVINPSDVVPFFNFFLPEKNVLGVSSIIQKDGTTFQGTPKYSDFQAENGKLYEVDALAEDTVFVEDATKPVDSNGVRGGKYVQTDNRFITEYTPESYFKIQFGAGTTTPNEQLKQFTNVGVDLKLGDYQNNIGLGLTVKPNTTIFVQYRVGGGTATNVGVGAINQVGTIDFVINGPNETINRNVKQSLSVRNVTAAVGGSNPPTTEEVRNMVAFNFAAQKRAVTVNDYKSIIDTMPGRFGAPGKVSITEKDNKIVVQLLSFETGGKLTQVASNNLKTNLATYLSKYRMVNDYIVIDSAKVIDLEFEISVVLESDRSQSEVVGAVISQVSDYMNPNNRDLGGSVNVSEIRKRIQNLGGILSVPEIKVFNKVGGKYSSSETSQKYLDPLTREIQLIDDTIFAEPDQAYQVRFDSSDIKVRTKTFKSVDFS